MYFSTQVPLPREKQTSHEKDKKAKFTAAFFEHSIFFFSTNLIRQDNFDVLIYFK